MLYSCDIFFCMSRCGGKPDFFSRKLEEEKQPFRGGYVLKEVGSLTLGFKKSGIMK